MPAPSEFVALYQREHPRLVGALGLLIGDRFLAGELAQEALIRACRDWEKVRGLDRPAAWLHRVAVNLAMSSHRRHPAEQRMLRRVSGRGSDAFHHPDTATAETVRGALRQLPIGLRAVVVLLH